MRIGLCMGNWLKQEKVLGRLPRLGRWLTGFAGSDTYFCAVFLGKWPVRRV
jgi:hypothetical protein